MRFIPIIVRIVFGFIFFASGLAGLLNLVPPPADLPEKMQTFMAGMMATTYFFPLLKGTETICGLLLLSGAFVPLALVILAPITLNILLTHAFLAPEGLVLALALTAMQIYLSFFANPYKQPILALFCPRTKESWGKN